MTWLARAMIALSCRLPRRLLEFWVERIQLRWIVLRWGGGRAAALATYRRVLGRTGREPSCESLEGLLDRAVRLHARLLISLLARPEDVAFARLRTELPCLQAIERGRAEGRGLVVTFSNFGLFTHGLMALLLRGLPMRIPVLDRRLYTHLPHGWPSSFLSLGEASSQCLRALRRNEIVVIPTVLNFLEKREAVEFFGAPARLDTAAVRLARAARSPLAPFFAVADDDLGRCRVEAGAWIAPDSAPGGAERMAALLARAQEDYIGRHPWQWEAFQDVWDLAEMDRQHREISRLRRWL